MASIILYVLGSFILPYVGYRIIRRLGRGRLVRGGTWEIRKSPTTNAFIGQVRLNGHKFDAVFDTGATKTTLGYDDARRIGINLNDLMFTKTVETASGKIAASEFGLDLFEVGPIQVRNMDVLVLGSRASGILVGMNFFDNLESFEIKKNRLFLRHGNGKFGFNEDVGQTSNSIETSLLSCPHCNQKMRLPSGKLGKIICVSCEESFDADTT